MGQEIRWHIRPANLHSAFGKKLIASLNNPTKMTGLGTEAYCNKRSPEYGGEGEQNEPNYITEVYVADGGRIMEVTVKRRTEVHCSELVSLVRELYGPFNGAVRWGISPR